MHSCTLILLFCCLFLQILSRPQGVIEDNDESEGEEKEYDMESVAADEDDARNKKQVSQNNYNSRSDRFARQSAYMPNNSGRLQEEKDTSDLNEYDQSSLKCTRNTYVDNSDTVDQQDPAQHLKYREVNSNRFNENDILSNKQTNKQAQVQSQDNMIFDIKSEINNIDNKKYGTNEVQNPNEGTDPKSYSNAIDTNDREIVVDENYDNRRYFLNRDTRQVKSVTHETEVTNLAKMVPEDEESAIKRHIRKLSKDELEELKNNLSDDKKILLQNVIDKINPSQSNDEGINKREITKKAGAIEEDSLMDSELSNSGKNQGVTSDLQVSTDSSVSQNTKNKETEQTESQSESSSLPSSKSAETYEADSKSGINSENEEPSLKNKRETNSDDFSDTKKYRESQLMKNDNQNWQDSLNKKECECSQDEDSSSFVQNIPQYEYNTRNKKRELYFENQADFCDSFKSLEESFPNSNINEDSIAYSGPLIRVKRKGPNQIVKKRSAGILPDAKVAYFPYKSENDDEDNDEGNEFDDEGFYDRTSNFAKKNEPIEKSNNDYSKLVSGPNQLDSVVTKTSDNFKQSSHTRTKLSRIENLNDEKTGLGSDTDSVLSGVEDTDDNLMFSSNFRDKRTVRDDNISSTDGQPNLGTENNLSPLNYQENDAFGPLPRNYESDLGRYKRIRRLKQSHLPLEENNSN
ncbi:hypothetical protein K1T71_010264 [Dendrolimus kikuchii]|uniref:Uncharacterized protein n=1 Tax=Dendrolimus kikuchii TaxID=765133 RepID=A0ACC1CRC9_9NEOP|nr:hypothetical protein K1T71_010264 [Dendrolimus kikuchii]